MRQKLLPNPPENLRFCVRECYGRQYEKESDYHGCEQARPDDIPSLFLVRFTDTMAAPSACRTGVRHRPRGNYPHIQTCPRGTDNACTQLHRHCQRALPTAAVCGTCSAEFAKQTKKGEKPRGELARAFGFNPFFLYCRVNHAANNRINAGSLFLS